MDLPEEFWFDPYARSQRAIKKLTAWTMAPERQYQPSARVEFLTIADSFLVAAADTLDATVVTFEQPAPNSKRKIMIPDSCVAMGVDCIDPYALFRRLGMRL